MMDYGDGVIFMDELITDKVELSVDTLLSRISVLESSLSAAREKQDFFYNQCKEKELKIRNLNAVFAANHREPLPVIVDQFMTNGRTALKKITSQMHLLEFDADNVKVMDTLIGYLYHLVGELETLREQYK